MLLRISGLFQVSEYSLVPLTSDNRGSTVTDFLSTGVVCISQNKGHSIIVDLGSAYTLQLFKLATMGMVMVGKEGYLDIHQDWWTVCFSRGHVWVEEPPTHNGNPAEEGMAQHSGMTEDENPSNHI